jgi:hypothetical protein
MDPDEESLGSEIWSPRLGIHTVYFIGILAGWLNKSYDRFTCEMVKRPVATSDVGGRLLGAVGHRAEITEGSTRLGYDIPTTTTTLHHLPLIDSITSNLSSALAFSVTMPVSDLAIYSRAQATGVLASSIFVGTFTISLPRN